MTIICCLCTCVLNYRNRLARVLALNRGLHAPPKKPFLIREHRLAPKVANDYGSSLDQRALNQPLRKAGNETAGRAGRCISEALYFLINHRWVRHGSGKRLSYNLRSQSVVRRFRRVGGSVETVALPSACV